MGTSLPQELTDKIIDEVAKDSVPRTTALQACSLVSRAWLGRSHKHLFSKVEFDHGRLHDWCSTVRPGENGPSRYVTRLHYRADYLGAYPESLVNDYGYMSYFTNVQTLHLSGVGLHRTEYVFSLMQLRSTVRFLELASCKMNINDLVTFLRPFTNLESLSLWGIYISHDKKLEKRGRLPTLKGQLDLNLTLCAGIRSFLHELSLLPLAFRDITLRDNLWLPGEVDQLLTASRKTLTMIRIINSHGNLIDLAGLDALEGLQLDAADIEYIPPILRTITSSKLIFIFLTLSDGDLEDYLKHPQEWTQLDLELRTLADRIRSARVSSNTGDGWCLWMKFFVTSPVSDRDFWDCAKCLLPRFSEHECVGISGELVQG